MLFSFSFISCEDKDDDPEPVQRTFTITFLDHPITIKDETGGAIPLNAKSYYPGFRNEIQTFTMGEGAAKNGVLAKIATTDFAIIITKEFFETWYHHAGHKLYLNEDRLPGWEDLGEEIRDIVMNEMTL